MCRRGKRRSKDCLPTKYTAALSKNQELGVPSFKSGVRWFSGIRFKAFLTYLGDNLSKIAAILVPRPRFEFVMTQRSIPSPCQTAVSAYPQSISTRHFGRQASESLAGG